jgi:hypothetical protein
VIAVEERRLKGLLKSAVTEVLQERGDLLRDAVRESFEDLALVCAIQLGELSRLISRRKVFQRLERGAGTRASAPLLSKTWPPLLTLAG